MVVSLTACSALKPGYEKPQVSVTSIALAPNSNSMVPAFLIGLKVTNPNRDALTLKGISYTLSVDDHQVLSGVNADLPEIPAYGSADISMTASPDLLNSAKVISQFLAHPQEAMAYQFKAKLDAGRLWPYITIEESGKLDLRASTTR